MTWQPDIAAQRKWAGGPREPLGQALDQVRRYSEKFAARAGGVAVKNTPYVQVWPNVTGTPVDTFINNPRILVPANKNRISLVMAQVAIEPSIHPTFATTYSFGYPAASPPAGLGQVRTILVPGYCVLIGGVVHHLGPVGNGTIAEDDIWITFVQVRPLPAPPFWPGYVIAYEGSLAVEAGRNRERAA